MNLSNKELDQLFENVRKEKPVASFDETQRAFLAATIASVGGVLATKSLLKVFTFKQWIIMISVLSTATVGALVITMSGTPTVAVSKTGTTVKPNAKEITVMEPEVKNTSKTPRKEVFAEVVETEIGKVIPRAGKNTIQVVAYQKEDGSYHFNYIITQETTEEDLKQLQRQAKEAGFELKYEPQYADNKLQRLSLHVTQEKENGSSQNIQISNIDLKENPSYRIAWNIDEKGAATTIACGEDYRSEELQELLTELEKLEMIETFEQLEQEFSKETMELDEEERVELELAWVELERAQEMLEVADLDAAFKELEELNDEALKEASEELERIKEEMAAQSEEMNRVARLHALQDENRRKCHEKHDPVLKELVADGLIDNRKDRMKMKMARGKLTVNRQEIPKKLYKKYEKLILKYFDFDISKKDVKWTWVHDEKDD